METATFDRVQTPDNLHGRVIRTLALHVIEAEPEQVVFPNEAGLCQQLGVSRSILREATKVLVDKGMVEIRPRSGMRSRPRSEWNLLDPDILGWQAKLHPDASFLRNLCEVRLAIEPTASGFAAVRATPEEILAIEKCLERRESAARSRKGALSSQQPAKNQQAESREQVQVPGLPAAPPARAANPANLEEAVELDLQFHTAVVAASHNPLFQQLNASIREPFRIALSYTVQLRTAVALDLVAYRTLLDAIRRRHALAARAAAEQIVGYAMLAVEDVIRFQETAK